MTGDAPGPRWADRTRRAAAWCAAVAFGIRGLGVALRSHDGVIITGTWVTPVAVNLVLVVIAVLATRRTWCLWISTACSIHAGVVALLGRDDGPGADRMLTATRYSVGAAAIAAAVLGLAWMFHRFLVRRPEGSRPTRRSAVPLQSETEPTSRGS